MAETNSENKPEKPPIPVEVVIKPRPPRSPSDPVSGIAENTVKPAPAEVEYPPSDGTTADKLAHIDDVFNKMDDLFTKTRANLKPKTAITEPTSDDTVIPPDAEDNEKA